MICNALMNAFYNASYLKDFYIYSLSLKCVEPITVVLINSSALESFTIVRFIQFIANTTVFD
jgi:hypothetical protein